MVGWIDSIRSARSDQSIFATFSTWGWHLMIIRVIDEILGESYIVQQERKGWFVFAFINFVFRPFNTKFYAPKMAHTQSIIFKERLILSVKMKRNLRSKLLDLRTFYRLWTSKGKIKVSVNNCCVMVFASSFKLSGMTGSLLPTDRKWTGRSGSVWRLPH